MAKGYEIHKKITQNWKKGDELSQEIRAIFAEIKPIISFYVVFVLSVVSRRGTL